VLQEAEGAIAPLTVKDDRFALELRAWSLLLLDRPEEARPLLERRISRLSVWLAELAARRRALPPGAA
jgi:hypothetical protein